VLSTNDVLVLARVFAQAPISIAQAIERISLCGGSSRKRSGNQSFWVWEGASANQGGKLAPSIHLTALQIIISIVLAHQDRGRHDSFSISLSRH